ncbi:MAG: hypothetical protein [Olavius algarvensis Delta 4 endosymbiont]|nr:MAG: hypothetical protein [Olavius algarvensis Delta 4 endosymbiont]
MFAVKVCRAPQRLSDWPGFLRTNEKKESTPGRILFSRCLFAYNPAGQQAGRALPLALLRLMIRRPALDDIRFLNPWVRARLILLG